MKEHCVNVKTFNCRDMVRNVTRNVQVNSTMKYFLCSVIFTIKGNTVNLMSMKFQVPIQKKIPITRMKCRQVYVPGRPTPPQRRTITRTRYRRVCYRIFMQ